MRGPAYLVHFDDGSERTLFDNEYEMENGKWLGITMAAVRLYSRSGECVHVSARHIAWAQKISE